MKSVRVFLELFNGAAHDLIMACDKHAEYFHARERELRATGKRHLENLRWLECRRGVVRRMALGNACAVCVCGAGGTSATFDLGRFAGATVLAELLREEVRA